MLMGKEISVIKWLHKASEKRRIMLPINNEENKCNCWFEVSKNKRDNIGTAIPTKAIGPQKAVVTPVNTEESKIK